MKCLALAGFLVALVLAHAAMCEAVVYVDKNATGAQNGDSWDNAYHTVQQGVSDADTLNEDVWVADGTYVENVVMGEGVAIYGGFLGAEPGGYETSLDQRDWKANIATIDGNQSGSCVVMAGYARVDGFTLTRGSGTPDPWGDPSGGGLYCAELSGPTVIANNVITDCSGGRGGAILCYLDPSPTIVNNVIAGNSSYWDGGGIDCNWCTAVITSNTITQNFSRNGGGIYNYTTSSVGPTVANNVIVGNSASWTGGGIFCSHSSPVTLSHNDFWGNTPDDYDGCSPGEGDISADPVFADPQGGDFHLSAGSPCIDAGTNDVPGLPAYDFEGDSRILNEIVDMGADEFSLIDTTPPMTTITLDGTLGSNGWYVSSVTVTLSATDGAGGSGVALTEYRLNGGSWTAYTGPFVISTEGTTTVEARSTDNAGNMESPVSEMVKIDMNPPTTTITLSGDVGDNDWYTSDVTVTLTATDDTSGVATTEYSLDGGTTWVSYSGAFVISTEGTTTVVARSTDNAGNAESPVSESAKIDKTAPQTVISLSGELGDNGWYTSNVTVTLDATDHVSGVATTEYSLDDGSTWVEYGEPFTIPDEGLWTVTFRSVDYAGNVEDPPATEPVKIDKTPPVLSAVPDQHLLWPPNHKMVVITIDLHASDNFDEQPTVTLVSALSSEEDDAQGGGDGHTTGDVQIHADNSVSVRAERHAQGDGRVYTMTYSVKDAAGNEAIFEAWVSVPHDMGEEHHCPYCDE